MHLKHSLKGLVVAAASAAAVLSLPVGPASATVDYTVTTNGTATGTTTVTATSTGNLILEDTYLGPFGTMGNPRVFCDLTTNGVANNGPHGFATGTTVTDAAVDLGPTSSSFASCPYSGLRGHTTVTVASGSVWKLGLTNKTATGGSAIVSGVDLRIQDSAGGLACQATVKGYLSGTYDHTTGALTLNPVNSLTVTSVTGTVSWCNDAGVFEGDPYAVAGTIRLSPTPTVS